MNTVEYIYFRCEHHNTLLNCPHQAQLLRPLDPSDLSQGFEFDLSHFECPEAKDQEDPECVDNWIAEVDD